MRTRALPLLSLLALAACGPKATSGSSSGSLKASVEASVDASGVVGAKDRSEADRALDAGRKPAEFLLFLGAKPGMKAAELFAGGGYTTELLARAVGPEGKVYGQNSKWVLERFAEKPWSERLQKPVMKNVVRVDRELDDPLPPEATGLDLVVSNAIYHDTVWQKIDRTKMNAGVLRALKAGGAYVICDSSAKDGAGTTVTETLHRIEEKIVRDDLEAAGFKLKDSSDILRNKEDTRDWSASPGAAGEKRGTSDRFCLKFVKPS